MLRLLPLLLLLALAACADGEETLGSAPPQPPSQEATATPTSSGHEAYVGLTEQEALARAQQEGVQARVVQRDGEGLTVTMDFNEARLNLTVADGKVTAVRRG